MCPVKRKNEDKKGLFEVYVKDEDGRVVLIGRYKKKSKARRQEAHYQKLAGLTSWTERGKVQL